MLSESQLSTLLNSAARAQSSSQKPGSSLIPFLCQALFQELRLFDLQLWQVEQEKIVQLWQARTDAKSFAIDENSLRRIEIGVVQSFDASSPADQVSTVPQQVTLTSCGIVEEARLTVAFFHAAEVDVGDDLIQISEILADLRRRELLRILFESNQSQSRLIRFLSELHECSSLQELLQLFVTDGAVVTGSDRISVATRQTQGGWSVSACTGVDSISPRSEEAQRIRLSIAEAEKSDQGQSSVFPLTPTHHWKGAQYAAYFESQRTQSTADLTFAQLLCSQMAMAMEHVGQRQSSRSRTTRLWRFKQVPLLISSVILIAVLALPFLKGDFKIRVFGQAVPQVRQEIFAPESGIIQTVKFEHGAFVKSGDVLFELYNDELYVLREKTRETLVTAEARLVALNSLSPRTGSNSQSLNGVLPSSVEQAELIKKIESIKSQVALIDTQIQSLQVTAPFSGQVFRERMQEELLGRPVQQGQYLMQIAALEGPWELQLRIPEKEIRHVLEARQLTPDDLKLTFALETAPELERVSHIDHLSATTDLDSQGRLSTLAIGRVEKSEIPDVRFGAGVLAKIHCGPRSLLFLMSRPLLEFWARYSPF